MAKILILANYDEGLYKFRKELVIELAKTNDVFVSVPSGKYINKIEELGAKVTITNFNRRGTNPFADIKLIKEYQRIIKKIKPSIVLTYTIKPNVYGGIACQKENIPYLVNITGLGSALENGGILQKVTLFLYKVGLKKANVVFFQNEANKEFMIKHKLVKDKFDLLPGSGVNLNDYQLIEYPNEKTIDFVYVGRLMKEKGIDQYLEAAEYIKTKYGNSQFHVCGFYEDNYKEIINELVNKNIIIYHGVVENMKDVYKDIHCTVHPTYYPEGLSNVLLESCASGRPIITTNRPGCREIIDDGFNGFVVEQKNTQDLIKQIEKFIKLTHEEKKQLGLNGRKKVEKEFDRNIVISKYKEAIDKYGTK